MCSNTLTFKFPLSLSNIDYFTINYNIINDIIHCLNDLNKAIEVNNYYLL